MEFPSLLKVFYLTSLSFVLSLAATPLVTAFLYKHKLGKQIRADGSTPLFTKMHIAKAGTPTMGGVLVWVTTAFLAITFWLLERFLNTPAMSQYNFLTRKETLLPLGAFLGASLVGLADDWLDIKKLGNNGHGLRFRVKIWLYAIVAVIGAWWFYFKLEFTQLHVPFFGTVDFGIWFIPFFLLVVIATSFAVNQTDGLDGLAGGISPRR